VIVVYVDKFAGLQLAADWKFIRSMVVIAIPFGLTAVFTTVYYSVDSVILGQIQGPIALGWYSAAYRFIVAFATIPAIMNVAIFPVMSKFYVSSSQALEKARDKYFKLLMMVSLPLAVTVTLLADKIIVLLFGLDYVQSIIALQILIWSLVFVFLNAPFAQLFNSTNNQGLFAKLVGFVLVENIIFNVILIMRFNYVGAAITELISDLTLFCLLFYFSYRLDYGIEKQTLLLNTSKIVFASAVVGVCIWALRSLNLIILLIFGVLLYLVVLYLIKGIDNEDIELLKQLPVFSQRDRARP
jgi:O-antigen/teichoic acid export membrane protein